MELLVDIGNTRIKWRWRQEGILGVGGSEPLDSSQGHGALFGRIWGCREAPSQVVVSNVAGAPIGEALAGWCLAEWKREPLFVRASARQCGVINGYSEPAALGVDRWCSLIGARTMVRETLCVVDCGTAITVDLLDAHGVHQGGLIAPGLRSMIKGLTASAGGIRLDGVASPGRVALGHSTVECVGAGVLSAAAGMVETALRCVGFPADGVLLLTGGDAPVVGANLQRPFRLEPDLVFHGLGAIAAAGGQP